MSTRRRLLLAIGAGALAAPFGAFAQQPGKIWRVGFLALLSRPATLDNHQFGGFVQGMRELGYVEGKNLAIEWRFAEGKAERLPGMAAELAQLKVDVILAAGAAPARTAQQTAPAFPIVMVGPSDAVGFGLIKSLARPGGNVTGVSSMSADLGPKRLELLQTIVPRLSRVAVLFNPDNTGQFKSVEILQAAGQKLHVAVARADARTGQEIDAAFAEMVRQKAGALIVSLDPIFQERRIQIAALCAKHRLPSMTPDLIYAEAGCLMSYGSSLAYMYQRAAIYVDKIFKGANPAELPVEQPTRFEFLINGRTAKTLGLTISQELLLQADKVIE